MLKLWLSSTVSLLSLTNSDIYVPFFAWSLYCSAIFNHYRSYSLHSGGITRNNCNIRSCFLYVTYVCDQGSNIHRMFEVLIFVVVGRVGVEEPVSREISVNI